MSLVVLNFNGQEHLEACLGSVAALDYPKDRLEIILCDNGSSDGSLAYVRSRFPEVRVVALDRNYGFAEGNNKAAAQARFDWVGFLNNDMRLDPGWLRNLVEPLREQPGLACLSSRIMNWDGTTIDFAGSGINFQGFGFQFDFGLRESVHNAPRRIFSPCGGAMLIRRQLFLDIGGFDPTYFGFYEDADLGWRLNLLGHETWYTPAATTYHRQHGSFKRIPDYKRRVLYERNAMATMYKCLDDDNLAVAWPAAILLLNEKALRIADIDPRPFRIAPTTELEPPGSNGSGPATASLAGKAGRVLREQGMRPLLGKATRYTTARAGRLLNRTRRMLIAGAILIPEVSVAHYVGLSEFAHRLDSLTEKRRWLQQRRVRSDAEILPLFHFALQPAFSDPEYIAFHHWLCQTLGLEERFRAGQDSPTAVKV